MKTGVKLIAKNRKAYFDYAIDETYEAGMVLAGTEIKSIKEGRIAFSDAWAEVVNGEIYLRQFQIAENPFASIYNHDPVRAKKLLLHKAEIKRLTRRVEEKGFTLIPLSVYLKSGRAKIELGVCKGKKQYDKRESIRERDLRLDTEREFRRGLSS